MLIPRPLAAVRMADLAFSVPRVRTLLTLS
nr:MAG TPA: hypothetical protein [Caudoviricetes sp.]